MMDSIIVLCIVTMIFFVIMLAAIIAYSQFNKILQKEKEENFVNKYNQINLGMTEQEVHNLLGTNYSESFLVNNIKKQEYRLSVPGYSARSNYFYKGGTSLGYSTHQSSYIIRATVKFKCGRVIEKTSLNMNMNIIK
jgi:uncharacterized protein YpmB